MVYYYCPNKLSAHSHATISKCYVLTLVTALVMIHNKYQSVMHSANTKRIDRIAIISLRRISKFTTLAVAGQRTKT